MKGDSMEAMAAVDSKDTGLLLREYYTEDGLAHELDVSIKTLIRWHHLGKGPRRTCIGRRIYYSRAAVRGWLESCEADPHQRDRRRRRK
jgi:hypothetical protein